MICNSCRLSYCTDTLYSCLYQDPKPQEDKPKQAPVFRTAQYDFEGPEDGDLSCKSGDKVEVVEQFGEDWIKGRLASGQEGMIPVAYLGQPEQPEGGSSTAEVSTAPPEPKTGKAVAQFKFESSSPGDLEFDVSKMRMITGHFNI